MYTYYSHFSEIIFAAPPFWSITARFLTPWCVYVRKIVRGGELRRIGAGARAEKKKKVFTRVALEIFHGAHGAAHTRGKRLRDAFSQVLFSAFYRAWRMAVYVWERCRCIGRRRAEFFNRLVARDSVFSWWGVAGKQFFLRLLETYRRFRVYNGVRTARLIIVLHIFDVLTYSWGIVSTWFFFRRLKDCSTEILTLEHIVTFFCNIRFFIISYCILYV